MALFIDAFSKPSIPRCLCERGLTLSVTSGVVILIGLQTFALYSREARLAQNGQIPYREAIVNIYLRRQALLTGNPYSIVCIGRGNDFLFKNGVLCYLRSNLIHILNVNDTGEVEVVFNLDIILRSWTEKLGSPARIKLLHYQEDVLVISVSVLQTRKVMVLSTKRGIPPRRRILAAPSVPCSRELLFRNDSKYLLIGERENSTDGNREWVFRVSKFAEAGQASSKAKRLCKIPSFESRTEIGTTLVLEIINGELWVMTSEITPDPEGLDPVSYYGGYRYTLDNPDRKPQYWRIQRRRQNEGPIHDHWTNVSLKKDEEGHYVIVESRKEWLAKHPDDALRSFYTTKFDASPLAGETSLDDSQEFEVGFYRENMKEVTNVKDYLPEDETEYVGTLLTVLPDHLFTSYNSLKRLCHHEYPSSSTRSGSSPPPSSAQTFSLSETPYRTYDNATATLLEIVKDASISTFTVENDFTLRLRIGHEGSKISLWPRDVKNTPASLRRLLQPRTLNYFRAISNERCIVFGARTGRNSPIVLISYDPSLSYGEKLDARRRETFGSSRTTFGVEGQTEGPVEQKVWGEYRESIRSELSPSSPPKTPPGASRYRSPVDEYPAMWTEELVWWRQAPEVGRCL